MLVDFKKKSQVTIPSKLVNKLKLKLGDKLEIHEENGRLIIEPIKTRNPSPSRGAPDADKTL